MANPATVQATLARGVRARAHQPRQRLWRAAAWLLLVILAAASVLAGVRWKADVQRERRNVFTTTASAIASSVATTLRRQTDLTRFEQALISLNPKLTNEMFDSWFRQLGAAERYPGGLGFGFVEPVPAGQLDEFARELAADPAPSLTVGPDFKVLPPGPRPMYCLLRLVVWLGPTGQLPPNLDYCAPTLPVLGTSPTAAPFATARDTGKLALAYPVALFPGEIFAFLPIYKGGGTPATEAERRAELLGWVAATFDGAAIIADAEKGHDDLRVEVIGKISGKDVVLASDGRKLSGDVSSLTLPVDGDDTWWVRVSGTAVSAGASADSQALVVGGLGIVISLLIFGVIQVLLRGRGRALRLVHERTEELRHRALHDDLTGLPNRALIMDRIEQMLTRSRRHGTRAAVLFIDLDSFKDVNDTYGHAVGDALLRAVAGRLASALRETDTAGRIGGDEFIVLAEGASLDEGVETVAARLLEVLHVPFTLDELPDTALDMRASVGVAVARAGLDEYETAYDTEDDLLRNADIALYQAKAAGKSQFSVFGG